MHSWLKPRTRTVRCAQSQNLKVSRPPAVRLSLEQLEDRWVPSPITHVQDIGTTNSTASAASLTITAPAAVAAGDTILLALAGSTSSATISVADTKGNTYHQDLLFLAGNPTSIYSAPVTNALAAGDKITVTFTGTPPLLSIATAVDFAGLAGLTVSPLDQTHTDNGLNNSPSSGPTAATTQAKELLFGAISTGAQSANATPPTVSFSPGPNYTALTSAMTTTVVAGSGTTFRLDPEFRLVSATGQYVADGTLTITGASVGSNWGAGIATYKALDTTTKFSVTASTPNPGFGLPFSVTVTAQDPSGTTATSYTGTVHLTSSDPRASLPADFTFTAADKGTHTFTNVVLNTAGAQTVTATDTNAAAGFQGSATVNVTYTRNQNWVAHAYAGLFGRPVDPAGLAFWTPQLDAGADRTQLALRMETSQEYLVRQINNDFILLLKHGVDPAGKSFFLNFRQGGGTNEQVLAMIANSQEYFTARAKGNSNTYAQTIFQDLLGRPLSGDAAGQAFFSQMVASGVPRDQIATEILTSLEYRNGLVLAAYPQFLKRNPDSTEMRWLTILVNGATDEQLYAGFMGSPEYYARP
jgi:hypothetical protein